MDRQLALTQLGFGVLACTSVMAVYKSWGDAGSVAFVLAADAALVLLFLCLRELERGRGGGEDGAAARRINMGGLYSALAKLGLSVLACATALDTYDARRDALSVAFVAVSYAALVILAGLFLRAVARAHGGEQGQAQAED